MSVKQNSLEKRYERLKKQTATLKRELVGGILSADLDIKVLQKQQAKLAEHIAKMQRVLKQIKD